MPACTLGNSLPMWILWTNTFISTVFPVSGSTVCGWWHMMHSSMLRREPPWKASWSWHLLQVAVRTTSRVLVGVPPPGVHVSVSSS